ncbi:hypothetical protein ACS65S_13325, partial [Staphylococcus saprophyticus]
AQIRYTQAEQNIMDKSKDVKASWKNQIRIAIEDTKEQAADFDEFNELLKPKGVEIARMTDKTITYKHIKEDKKCVVANLVKITRSGVDNGFRLEKLNSYAETIHDQIVQGESIWRYLSLFILSHSVYIIILYSVGMYEVYRRFR